jgi:hypothetical protein
VINIKSEKYSYTFTLFSDKPQVPILQPEIFNGKRIGAETGIFQTAFVILYPLVLTRVHVLSFTYFFQTGCNPLFIAALPNK